MKDKFVQGTISANNLKFPNKYIGKQKENITFRSSWERKMIIYFDQNPAILEWSSEEIIIPYIHPLDKKRHRYFPDFYIKVKKHDSLIEEVIVEVKPKHETVKPVFTESTSQRTKNKAVMTFVVNQAKWDAAKEYCRNKGMKFIVLTEQDICFK